MKDEDVLLAAVLADPLDRLARAAWADRLEERGAGKDVLGFARLLPSFVSCREYGGGDDRWCIHRNKVPTFLWRMLLEQTAGPGTVMDGFDAFPFVEFRDRKEAYAAMAFCIDAWARTETSSGEGA